MTIPAAELDREAAGRRAYPRGFEEALRRARETADHIRERDGGSPSAGETAPFVKAQIAAWVAQWSPQADITPDERAYRHGFGDVARALEEWSAPMSDAAAQLRDYTLAEVLPWVDDRPRDGFALRSMPRRFAPKNG